MKIRKTYLHILILSLNLILSIGFATLIQADTADKKVQPLTFYVSGEVNFPGVYIVEEGVTMAEAILHAGGLTVNADASSLDLAEKITNYQSLHISANKYNNIQEKPVTVVGLINLNLASSAELDTLPGIGPALAAKIIEKRPYKTLADLEVVSGISKSVLENIKDLIAF